MLIARRRQWALGVTLLVGVLALASCDDPTAFRRPPVDPRMMVLMDLDPDLPTQPVFVTSFDQAAVEDLTAELWSGGALVATGQTRDGPTLCRERFSLLLWVPNGGGYQYCRVFDHAPEPGATYELVVSASDRPTATGTTTVPGDFDIVSGVATGDPPGTERLEATWTRSDPTHRYMVMVRAPGDATHSTPEGIPYGFTGWILVTTDTAVSTRRPRDEVVPGGPNTEWLLSVYSVDQAMYDYITSGTQEFLFPVPPASNVVNGFGVVGSWVRKSIPVDSLPAG